MENVTVICNKPHDIPRHECAFCTIDRLRSEKAELVATLRAVVKADIDYQHAQSFLNSVIEQEMANESFTLALKQARAALAKADRA